MLSLLRDVARFGSIHMPFTIFRTQVNAAAMQYATKGDELGQESEERTIGDSG